jgi:hypothetical protein
MMRPHASWCLRLERGWRLREGVICFGEEAVGTVPMLLISLSFTQINTSLDTIMHHLV